MVFIETTIKILLNLRLDALRFQTKLPNRFIVLESFSKRPANAFRKRSRAWHARSL